MWYYVNERVDMFVYVIEKVELFWVIFGIFFKIFYVEIIVISRKWFDLICVFIMIVRIWVYVSIMWFFDIEFEEDFLVLYLYVVFIFVR